VVRERLRGRILAAIDTDSDLPALAALRLVLDRLGRLVADERLSAIPKLIISESGTFPDLAEFYVRDVIKPVRDRLAALIATGIARGEFVPVKPEIVAKLIIAPVLLAALWRHTFAPFDSLDLNPGELLAEHLGILERGLRASPTRLP
jgi:Tetracyclin repressor-like, C-terminal domain